MPLRALQNRFSGGKAKVQPVVRLVADAPAQTVAGGEAVVRADDGELCQHV